MRPRGKGFTFIELLFVILVIGVLAGVSFPRLKNSFLGMRRDGAARDVYYLARSLQESAISQGTAYCLHIDPAARKMWATSQPAGGPPAAGKAAGNPKSFPEGITLSVVPAQEGVFYFYPDGSIEPDGKVVVSAGIAGTRVLAFTGASGDIRIEEGIHAD